MSNDKEVIPFFFLVKYGVSNMYYCINYVVVFFFFFFFDAVILIYLLLLL